MGTEEMMPSLEQTRARNEPLGLVARSKKDAALYDGGNAMKAQSFLTAHR